MKGEGLDIETKNVKDALTHSILGAAFEVSKILGAGLKEKVYENALKVELALRGHDLDQQRAYPVDYKGHEVGVFVPDLCVDGQVIAEVKAVEKISDQERAQLISYLHVTKIPVGLILNFRHRRLEYERLVGPTYTQTLSV